MSDLVWAIKNGDLDRVRELSSASGFDVNAAVDGRSPLHFAADYGQLEVIEFLVGKGADLEAKDKHGISVVLAAIWEGHSKCVAFLISKGCSKSGSAPDGTPYLEAAEKEDMKALLR